MSFKVYITRKLPDEEIGVLKTKTKINYQSWETENAIPRDKLLEHVKGCNGILCTVSDHIDKEVLDAAGSQLKVISTVSAGTTHIDMAECKKRNIQVYETPNMASDTCAEFTVTLVLLVARRFLDGMDAVVRGEWGLWKPMWICGFEMGGRTLGLYGFGRVGFGVARRMRPFNVKEVLYFDVCRKEYEKSVEAQWVQDPKELVKRADILCICCPVNALTTGAFNKDMLALMKDTSILINTSRGQIVVNEDLDAALKKGRPSAAALDVTDPEPLPPDHPLMKNPKCIITPHLATASWATRKNMTREAVTNLCITLLGKREAMDHCAGNGSDTRKEKGSKMTSCFR